MFPGFLRKTGIDPNVFPKFKHEFIGGGKPTVGARLYPIEYLPEFRKFFNEQWLPKQAKKYFENRAPQALEYLLLVQQLHFYNTNFTRM